VLDSAQSVVKSPGSCGQSTRTLVEPGGSGHLPPDPEDARLGELPRTEADREMVLARNTTDKDYPSDQCLHQLFEAQCQRTPNAIAVVSDEGQLTYCELNQRANLLAHHLSAAGVGPDVLVGAYLERSLDTVVGILGTIKAGGAYVPLDPDFPAERLSFMMDDAQVSILLTHARRRKSLPSHTARALCLDADWPAIARNSNRNPAPRARPSNLMYVLYTSGSTGKPKGVQIEHRSVVNFLWSMRERPGLSAKDTVLAVTTLSFDIAVLELWLPLILGAQVRLASREVARDGTRLRDLLAVSGATVLQATPSTWRLLLEAGWTGTPGLKMLCGGEALSPSLAEELLPKGAALWNMYGPTETTVWSTVHQIVPKFPISVGRPIANTVTFIVDDARQPVPMGVAGELLIGGHGVARGYLNRPDLDQERFIRNPFSTNPADRLYRTGDLARYRADGCIEIVGRMDHQVKLRGYRIELGEIEAALEQHPGVHQAAAVVNVGANQERQLTAYVVPKRAAPSASELREHLGSLVPEYMIPATFVLVDALPLTPNGKVDRRALPGAHAVGTELGRAYEPARTKMEKMLAETWCAVFGLSQAGIRDNFFELGGDSLLALRLCIQIEKALGIRIPLASLYKTPTIEGLAIELENTVADAYRTEPVPVQPHGSKLPVFFMPSMVGEVMYFRQLASHLGGDQPVYGVQMLCGDGTTQPLDSMQAIAARCVKDVQSIQPEGPYTLTGYSFGGMLAFEVAQQLLAMGQQIRLLALIDIGVDEIGFGGSRSRLRVLWRFLRNLPYWFIEDLLKSGPAGILAAIRRKARAVRSGRRSILDFSPTTGQRLHLEDLFDIGEAATPYRRMMEANLRALREYIPKVYPGRVTLLRARARPLFEASEFDLGWGGWVKGGVVVRTIPGNHETLMKEPFVQNLAARLKAALSEADIRISPSCETSSELASALHV
jgi:amino acid adenylation domain-containing protein